jgi:hypothetical protein
MFFEIMLDRLKRFSPYRVTGCVLGIVSISAYQTRLTRRLDVGCVE